MWLTIAEKKFLYLAENFLVMIYNMMNKKYTIKLSKHIQFWYIDHDL